MAKNSGQKLKLLYIVKILLEESDEQHVVSTKMLIDKLSAYGISAERKSIYDDIAKLQDYGYDIIQSDNRNGGGYYLASREFELAELKFLVDAVQSTRFITQKKSSQLIKKLEQLTSKHDAKALQRQVYVSGRVKTENESIYYSIDSLHKAIQDNKQIVFTYMEWNSKKELVPRKEGQEYRVSPWTLICQDENYYMAAFDESAGIIKHYRVDKMANIRILSEARTGASEYEKMNPAEYTNRTFSMFGGELEDVSLIFPEKLIGVVIDRFGKEIPVRKEDNKLRARVKVVVSPPFFGWLATVGKDVQIVSPENVKEQYITWLEALLKEYKQKEG